MSRAALLASIAETIRDYREGEIARPDAAHVDRWIKQFLSDQQVPILTELDYLLKRTYFTKRDVRTFLNKLVTNQRLVGENPCQFWRNANFLDIQQNGHSQHEMLEIFTECLDDQCNIEIDKCGSVDGPYIYIDDVIFSGMRIGNDLETWIRKEAPQACVIHVIVIGFHKFGQWKLDDRVREVSEEVRKNISINYWRTIEIENRKSDKDESEVLWPAKLPTDTQLVTYLALQHRYPFEPRRAGGKTEHDIFSSEAGRQILETEMVLAGVKIRGFCQNPKDIIKPLGFSPFGLGFGSTIVTFRNCPNNCPLAFWWGDPESPEHHPFSKWYPLFPRKTYGNSTDEYLDE